MSEYSYYQELRRIRKDAYENYLQQDLEDLTNYQDYISCNAWHNYGLMY